MHKQMNKMISGVLHYVDEQQDAARERLFDLLRIPSISTQKEHREDCRRAAQWLVEELRTIGFAAETHDVKWAEPGHPMVVGHADENDAYAKAGQTHVLFYGHYDVQPTDPDHLWHSKPFEPCIKEDETGRKVIVARGASDDKGQVMTFIEACRAWKAVHGRLPVAVTILLEGEEESGGENLLPFLKAHQADLRADIALICDTAMPNRHTPAITTSLRGTVAEEICLTAAKQDLHSGMYGNAAANPAYLLCRLISGLRDETGRITLPGFYDGVAVPDGQTRAQWAHLYPDDSALLGEVGLSHAAGEQGFSAIEQTWCRPSFEVNGIGGGYQDDGFKTVIPAQASAKLSFRLVPGQDPLKIREAFRAYVRDNLPEDVTVTFTSHGASAGFAVEKESPYLAATLKALSEEWGEPAVTTGCGGSIPVAEEVRHALGMDALMVGFAQADDHIHSPNEQYGFESFHHGIRSWVRILAALAE
ncbi:hypothetical protein BG621_07455 [Parasaccharibacter apium]|nr:hypothetical protein BG621_07455 [Parasaccharibacter apium]